MDKRVHNTLTQKIKMLQLDNKSLFELHSTVQTENVDFLYKGVISVEVVNELLKIVKKKFNAIYIDYSLRKKIYNIAVECLENITQHSKNGGPEDSIFIIGVEREIFFIGAGNYVTDNDAINLGSQLNLIQGKSKDQLKTMYRKKMTSQVEDLSNNAGLGLLDIAIKSGNSIDYSLHQTNPDEHFFTMQVQIKLAS